MFHVMSEKGTGSHQATLSGLVMLAARQRAAGVWALSREIARDLAIGAFARVAERLSR